MAAMESLNAAMERLTAMSWLSEKSSVAPDRGEVMPSAFNGVHGIAMPLGQSFDVEEEQVVQKSFARKDLSKAELMSEHISTAAGAKGANTIHPGLWQCSDPSCFSRSVPAPSESYDVLAFGANICTLLAWLSSSDDLHESFGNRKAESTNEHLSTELPVVMAFLTQTIALSKYSKPLRQTGWPKASLNRFGVRRIVDFSWLRIWENLSSL